MIATDTNLQPSSPLRSSFQRTFYGRPSDRKLVWFVIVVFCVTFLRPQEVIPALAPLKIAITLQVIGTLLWLPSLRRGLNLTTVLFGIFLALEALRLVVGYFFGLSSILVNHFWQFQMLRDLGLQFTSLVFPVAIFAASGISLRRLLFVMGVTGCLLIVWIVTHAGTGPGGFINDENDSAFCLLFFLGPLLTIAIESRVAMLPKLLAVGSALATMVGVTATLSRGGFVGMMAALGYLFIFSRRKMAFIVVGIIMACGVALMAPSTYVKEMETISTEDSTAVFRFFYWSLAWRIWKAHPLTGVGLGSASLILGDYQTPEELMRFPKASGRAVHSLYFQALGDIGLIGIFLLGLPLFMAFKDNIRTRRKLYTIERQFRNALRASTDAGGDASPADAATAGRIIKEIDFIRAVLLGLNVSFAGCMVSGAFVSVLLYPPLWFLCGLSLATQSYAAKLTQAISLPTYVRGPQGERVAGGEAATSTISRFAARENTSNRISPARGTLGGEDDRA